MAALQCVRTLPPAGLEAGSSSGTLWLFGDSARPPGTDRIKADPATVGHSPAVPIPFPTLILCSFSFIFFQFHFQQEGWYWVSVSLLTSTRCSFIEANAFKWSNTGLGSPFINYTLTIMNSLAKLEWYFTKYYFSTMYIVNHTFS